MRLAPEVNLADPSQAAFYAQAEVKLKQPKRTIQGAPIVYGVTVPSAAPNPVGGAAFIQALLSAEGRRLLDRNGFDPLPEYVCDHPDCLPKTLREAVSTRATGQAP